MMVTTAMVVVMLILTAEALAMAMAVAMAVVVAVAVAMAMAVAASALPHGWLLLPRPLRLLLLELLARLAATGRITTPTRGTSMAMAIVARLRHAACKHLQ